MAIGRLGRRWRIALWVAGIAAATAIGVWGAPALIRAAYAGESWPLFNRIISGRSSHPVEYYLESWRRGFTVLFVAAATGSILALVRRRPWLRTLGERLGREPALSPGRVVELAVWVGAVAGIAQAIQTIVPYLVARHASRPFQWEAMWMAPWSAALAFAVIASLGLFATWLLGRPRGGRLSATGVVFTLAFVAVIGIVSTSLLSLAPWATLLLAGGVASIPARGAAASPGRWERIERRSLPYLAGALVVSTILGVLALPGPLENRRLASLPRPVGDPPDIVLIILDTVRASNLGLYGYARPTTPNLDRAAGGGVTFTNAIAPAPWTLPSHASLFTGRLPRRLTTRVGVPLDDRWPTLAEILAERGYHTAGFTANFSNTSEATGVARGFHRYEDFPVTAGRFFVSSWPAHEIARRIPGLLGTGRLGRKVARLNTDDFLRWLEDRPDGRPFFAFLNYMDAHAPYQSPARFRAKFPSEREVIQPSDAAGLTEEELEGTVAAYDAAIAYLDEQIGRILHALERTGREDALVIVSSDHGEHFGEHGLVEHGGALYEPVLRIPLVFLHPDLPGGRRIDPPVSLRHVAATIADLALGAPDARLGGRSLAAMWRHPDPPTVSAPAFAETTPDDFGWTGQTGQIESVFLRSMHYIRSADGAEELFDLGADPRELVDLSGVPAYGSARRELAAVLDSLHEVAPRMTGGADGDG